MKRIVDGEIEYLHSNYFLGMYYVAFENLLISLSLHLLIIL